MEIDKKKDEATLPPAYIAEEYEKAIYTMWEESGYFNPDNLPKKRLGLFRKKPVFSIVMPPPNTTGILHLGHASALAYEDLMIRYKRLRGYTTLYLPGTDHAAISTQNKVEKILKKEGTDRHALGREKFLERVRAFVAESQDTIKNQVRTVGTSCDWSREAYTFDEVSSRVVNEVFIRMYNDGIIYRGNRIVNWCVRCNSAIADDEVKYIEKKTSFYYFKYGPVIIGTARPETKFQDKVIVVHPDDKRYESLIGKEFDVPWIEGTVKGRVIADEVVDPELGTGAMTITPAHSFDDFELAKKYDLEITQIIGTDGKLTEAAGSFAGKDARESRDEIVAKLKKQGLVDHIDEEYIHNLSVCDRCETPVEPLISRQWFVDVNKKIPGRGKSLKQLAIELVKRHDIEIIPNRFRKIYFHWMDNLHDWCISRQIWWGHRIPVWYCITCHDDPKKYEAGDYWEVGEEKPALCSRCGEDNMHQDHDTLDTWFSSATWTFSTLLDRDTKKFKDFDHWLKGSRDLKRFHPTSVLETGYDIIFFWIARMIIITSYVMHEKPFSNVYLHGMVLDKGGRKMSKSLDNGIDPIDVIKKYGADAMRLSLIIGSTPGQDVRLYDEKIAGYRNFINKLWNIARFITMTVDKVYSVQKKPQPQTIADTWILDRFEETVRAVTKHIEQWQFSMAGEALYAFTWRDLADWYLEIAKIQRSASSDAKETTDAILLYILERLLVLWHPFAPFVTEVVGKQFKKSEPMMIATWPRVMPKPKVALRGLKQFAAMQEIINEIRRVRAERQVPAKTIVRAQLESDYDFTEYISLIEKLARCELSKSVTGEEVRTAQYTLRLDVQQYADDKKGDKVREYIAKLEAKLAKKDFTQNAPSAVIAAEKKKLAEARAKLGDRD